MLAPLPTARGGQTRTIARRGQPGSVHTCGQLVPCAEHVCADMGGGRCAEG